MGSNYIKYFFFFLFFLSCDGTKENQIDYVKLLNREPDGEQIILRCDKDYEKELYFPTILTLSDKYVMYYVVSNGKSLRSLSTCYAESYDGINWVKPNLGLVEYNGSTDNNIISNDFESISVEYHNNTFYLFSYSLDFKTDLYKSTDGIIFSKVESFNIPYCCDSQNQILWDKNDNIYKIYMRSWYKSDNKNITYNHTDSLYRSVSLLMTKNIEDYYLPLSENPFYRWGDDIPPAINNELPVVMKNNSDEDYDIYNPCVHQYGNTYIAYPILYYHLPEPPQGGTFYNDGYAAIAMWGSNDGINFLPVNNNYINNKSFNMYAIGHIETDTEVIHYYVNSNKLHGDTSFYDENSTIVARIHYK